MVTLIDSRPPVTHESLFTDTLPQLPKAWDSTMLGLLKECPRKFYYTIILGYQGVGFAAHLAFGIAYHKALEVFDIARAQGDGYDLAQLKMVEFCMGYGYRDEKGDFQPYDAAYTNEPSKTRDTLLRACIWYTENYRNDACRTVILKSGRPAVELSFKIELDLQTPDGEAFLLCGHLDRLVELNDTYWFMDRKTSKNQLTPRFFNQFSPNNQMSLYYSATQIALEEPAKGGIIDAIELGASYCRFKRHTITRTTGIQHEWLTDLEMWIMQAQTYAEAEYWPLNDKSCSNYGGCTFQVVCSRDPSVRQTILDHEGYVKRQWNPLESR